MCAGNAGNVCVMECFFDVNKGCEMRILHRQRQALGSRAGWDERYILWPQILTAIDQLLGPGHIALLRRHMQLCPRHVA